MSSKTVRNGRPFGIGGDIEELLLAVAGKDIDPLTPFYELATNAMEAFGVCRIWQVKPGSWVVADAGCGMSKDVLLQRLTNWASSTKGIGPDENFGAGIKFCVARRLVSSITVTSREKDGTSFFQVEFGEYGKDGRRGPLSTIGNDQEFVREVKAPFGGKYSTVVEFEIPDKSITPDQVFRALNKRLQRIPTPIEVNLSNEGLKNPRWVALKGAIALHEESCKPKMFDEIDLTHCKVLFGIRPEGYKSTEWDVPSLLVAHVRKKCIYYGVTISSHDTRKLPGWGIFAGHDQISMIVIPKGKKLAINLGRDDISGWDEAAAKEEFAENMPPLLNSFMEVFKAENTQVQDKVLNESIKELLAILGLGKKPDKKPRPDIDDPIVVTPVIDTPPPKEIKPRKKRKPKTGTPGIAFATLKATCGQGLMYDPVEEVLHICYETEEFMEGLKQARMAKQELNFRTQVAVGCLSGFCKNAQQYAHVGLPSAEVLAGIYGASIVGAMTACLPGKGTIVERIQKFNKKT